MPVISYLTASLLDPLARLSQSDALNLDRHALGQLVHGHTAPGRLVREELLIRGVHLGEVIHGCEEDVDFDDFGLRGASLVCDKTLLLEGTSHVCEDLLCGWRSLR